MSIIGSWSVVTGGGTGKRSSSMTRSKSKGSCHLTIVKGSKMLYRQQCKKYTASVHTQECEKPVIFLHPSKSL